MLNDMGFDVMLQVSGSTSTLLGAFFLGMSDHASGTELDAAGVKAMFAGGLANVQKQTKAQLVFQLADPLTDGPLGQMQLIGGQREAQPAGCNLEGVQ